MSTPPLALQKSTNPADEAIEGLMARQAQLEEKWPTLLQLQQIDEEQDRIKQRLSVLRQEQQSIQPLEMPQLAKVVILEDASVGS